jgi:hypothetical protein
VPPLPSFRATARFKDESLQLGADFTVPLAVELFAPDLFLTKGPFMRSVGDRKLRLLAKPGRSLLLPEMVGEWHREDSSVRPRSQRLKP